MPLTPAEKSAAYRARKKAGVTAQLEPCPSPAAAKRHLRNGGRHELDACPHGCADALRAYQRTRRQQSRKGTA